MGISTRQGVPSTVEKAVRRYREEARRLPDPGETWTASECDFGHGVVNSFSRSGVINHVGWTGPSGPRLWETARGVTEWVEHYLEERSQAPCGHTGVRCVESGEVYTCTEDACDVRFDRETALEVVG